MASRKISTENTECERISRTSLSGNAPQSRCNASTTVVLRMLYRTPKRSTSFRICGTNAPSAGAWTVGQGSIVARAKRVAVGRIANSSARDTIPEPFATTEVCACGGLKTVKAETFTLPRAYADSADAAPTSMHTNPLPNRMCTKATPGFILNRQTHHPRSTALRNTKTSPSARVSLVSPVHFVNANHLPVCSKAR